MAWQPQPGQYDSPYSDAGLHHSPPSLNNGLNGFKDHGLDDDAFGAKGSIVSAFDAFRKSSHYPGPGSLWPSLQAQPS